MRRIKFGRLLLFSFFPLMSFLDGDLTKYIKKINTQLLKQQTSRCCVTPQDNKLVVVCKRMYISHL